MSNTGLASRESVQIPHWDAQSSVSWTLPFPTGSPTQCLGSTIGIPQLTQPRLIFLSLACSSLPSRSTLLKSAFKTKLEETSFPLSALLA